MVLAATLRTWQRGKLLSFDNCTEAYKAGYANIPKGSKHYGKHLDRDGDGYGCDQPPSWFKAHETSTQTGTKVQSGIESGNLPKTGPAGEIGVGVAAVLAGAVIMAVLRRRKTRFTA